MQQVRQRVRRKSLRATKVYAIRIAIPTVMEKLVPASISIPHFEETEVLIVDGIVDQPRFMMLTG